MKYIGQHIYVINTTLGGQLWEICVRMRGEGKDRNVGSDWWWEEESRDVGEMEGTKGMPRHA